MTVLKAVKYARMPIHLRWELYPCAPERGNPGGGSYFENLDWRTQHLKKNLLGKTAFMASEILFFKTYFRAKRGYWFFLFPFHIGIFSLIIWLALLLAGAVMGTAGIIVSNNGGNFWGTSLYSLTVIAGSIGYFSAACGCLGLIIKRLGDEDLRIYSSPKEYLTLFLMLATFLSGFIAWAFFDPSFHAIRGFMLHILTLRPVRNLNPATSINILLISFFLSIAPFTRMMHFLGKYFSFHDVRWDDHPNLNGSKMREKIEDQLNCVMTWSAPHVPSGKKWREVSSEVSDISENKDLQ